jgi:uncharacterized membrane protein
MSTFRASDSAGGDYVALDASLVGAQGGADDAAARRRARDEESWADDANWRPLCGSPCGILYYGYDDSRLCVRRRIVRCCGPCKCFERVGGFGLSLNLGHPRGCTVLVVIVLLALAGEGISWAVTLFKANLG